MANSGVAFASNDEKVRYKIQRKKLARNCHLEEGMADGGVSLDGDGEGEVGGARQPDVDEGQQVGHAVVGVGPS